MSALSTCCECLMDVEEEAASEVLIWVPIEVAHSPRDTSASSPLVVYTAQPHLLSAVDRTVIDRTVSPVIDRTVSPRPLPTSGDVTDRTIVDQAIEKGP